LKPVASVTGWRHTEPDSRLSLSTITGSSPFSENA
jgi:hypothetical protein